MRKDLKNVLRVLVAIVLGMVVCWLIGGCSPRVVEVERPVIVEQTHTQTHTDIVRDTLIWRDSVYHYVQGDTVRIERWHHVANVSKMIVADTIRDTIPRIVPVKETVVQEVNQLHWWQKVLCWVGGIGIAVTALLVAVRIKRSRFFS
jgi:hypothetical protein